MSSFSSSPFVPFVVTAPVDAEPITPDLSTRPVSAENMRACPPLLKDTGASVDTVQGALVKHQGKLAVGVAATLGLLVFYQWRANHLATQAPDDYRRLQRIRQALAEQTTQDPDTRVPAPSSGPNEV